jgi:hypothetical protein
MNTAFANMFDAIHTTLGTAASATIKRGRDEVACMCASGVQTMRAVDETGRIIGKSAQVRYKASDEPSKPIKEGDVVDLVANGIATKMRVEGRVDVAQLVRLMLTAEFE